MSTWTPAGIAIGNLPIRDTVILLPDLTNQFATDIQLACALTGHDTLGCGKDGNTDARKNPRDILLASINSASRAADAFEAGNDWFFLAPFAQVFNLQP
jgi:hypothetical protein